jgi:hypothetical protein
MNFACRNSSAFITVQGRCRVSQLFVGLDCVAPFSFGPLSTAHLRQKGAHGLFNFTGSSGISSSVRQQATSRVRSGDGEAHRRSMAPRVAPAVRVLPLALAAALFFGVTAILIYLSGLSSCNARPPSLFFRVPVACGAVRCGRSC